VSEWRKGENPARWKGHLEHLLAEKSKVHQVVHHSALPYQEIARFMAELREQGGLGARALEFAILTAARTGEVIGHEATGVVEALGPGAERYSKVGDRVILGLGGAGGYWCGACDYCLGGEPRLCKQSKGIMGTFAAS